MAAIPRLADNSPTANLLRNSRLFSLPQPLPRPNISTQFGDRLRTSDSATTPYPTHQIIATTEASRSRGDWGLKRPLPLKSTSSTRSIRIRALDTYDQVTEFDSGHNYAATLKKLQELNLSLTRHHKETFRQPISTKNRDRTDAELPSAFESAYDNTEPRPMSIGDAEDEKTLPTIKLAHRWRSRGPELKAMSQAEFNMFVERELVGRREEFEAFLKAHRVKTHLHPIAVEIYDEGNRMPDLVKELIKWIDQSTLPAAESYLAAQCNSSTMDLPLSMHQWIKPTSATRTPAWMPSRPALPTSFESHAWKGDLAHRLIHGRRKRQDSVEDTDEMVDVAVDEAFGAADLRTCPSRDFDKSSVDQNYTKEERAYVATLLKQAQEKFFTDLDRDVVSTWAAWLAEFRATSGTNKDNRHIIEYFLDLPKSVNKSAFEITDMSTHPSAGVSYRRAARSVINHPVFGPLDGPDVVQARLVPSGAGSRIGDTFRGSRNNMGVAGVILHSTQGLAFDLGEGDFSLAKKTFDSRTGVAEVPTRGTPRKWVKLGNVTIRNDGRIEMAAAKSNVSARELVVEKRLEQDVQLDAELAKDPLKGAKTIARATPFPGDMVKGGRLMESLDNDGKTSASTHDIVPP